MFPDRFHSQIHTVFFKDDDKVIVNKIAKEECCITERNAYYALPVLLVAN